MSVGSIEHWLVSMPANAGTGWIFVDEDLLKAFRGDISEGRRPVAQRKQERRDGIAVPERPASIVVAHPNETTWRLPR
jgi:hypothetical protein